MCIKFLEWSEEMMCVFKNYIKNAIGSIQEGNIDEAQEEAKLALALKPEAPEPHNILGIIAEYIGDRESALKHYRASWALEASYQPAYKNLDRLTSNYNSKTWRQFDLGIEELTNEEVGEEEEK